MRRAISAILSVTAVFLMAAGVSAQQKPSFTGDWKIMRDASAGGGQGEPGVDLTIKQDATSLSLDYRAGGLAPAPGKLTYKLDGSPNKNVVPGAGGAPTEQMSRATWAGDNLVVTTTTAAGDEKRTFTIDGGYLVVETSSPGGKPSKVVYQRYQRGFGG